MVFGDFRGDHRVIEIWVQQWPRSAAQEALRGFRRLPRGLQAGRKGFTEGPMAGFQKIFDFPYWGGTILGHFGRPRGRGPGVRKPPREAILIEKT